jgi:hypothetical protein
MASKVKVLQTIAGISYGKAEPGEIMIFPENDAQDLESRGLVKIIGHERGGNLIKPYSLTRPRMDKAVTHSISRMTENTSID